jgi:hypothetical protein
MHEQYEMFDDVAMSRIMCDASLERNRITVGDIGKYGRNRRYNMLKRKARDSASFTFRRRRSAFFSRMLRKYSLE